MTLTTNGSLLGRMAAGLRSAGLTRLTVSLDALEDSVFRAMNDVDFPVERVLEGIAAAKQARFSPIKINMVVKRGVNERALPEMARYCRAGAHVLRCIEYMDVGHSNGWRLTDVVRAPEILAILEAYDGRLKHSRRSISGRSRTATAIGTAAGRSVSSPP